MTQPVICQDCQTEMEPGKTTQLRVIGWTEYTCPKCGSVWSERKPLPGHARKPIVPKVALETEPGPPAKKKARKKAVVPKTKAKAEEMSEEIVADEDLVAGKEEVTKVKDDA